MNEKLVARSVRTEQPCATGICMIERAWQQLGPDLSILEARRVLRMNQLEPVGETNVFECRNGPGGKTCGVVTLSMETT